MRAGPETILRLIALAMGGLAIVAAAVELRDAVKEDGRSAVAVPSDDPLRRELARCRTLTPEALEAAAACRATWAENRRRFFGRAAADPEG